MNQVFEKIKQWHQHYIDFRRDLHAHPEVGFDLSRTREKITTELRRLGIDFHDDVGGGIVAVIPGVDPSSRGIGLRADMDALPMQEENTFAHASQTPGRMHGCGHDGHTATLMACAQYLQENRHFSGTAYLIFQPAEEGKGGGLAMIQSGLFERFPIDNIFALHNWPELPFGKIAVQPGPVMAACDKINIEIEGRGGHAAHPHLTVDPVVVAGQLITAVQSIVARNVDPYDAAVISICGIEAGNMDAMNVIPSRARMIGTVRTFSLQVQDTIEKRLREMIPSLAQAMGAKASIDYERIDPATVNDAQQTVFAEKVAIDVAGAENVVRDLHPSMGAEDFSYMLLQKPGAYLRIGQQSDQPQHNVFLHNGQYDFNDDVIPLGAALLAGLVERDPRS